MRPALKTALLTLLLGGFLVSPSLAQSSGSSPRGPGRMQARLLEGITLSPAQQAKVDSITAHYRSQMPQWTPGTPPSQADREKAMQQMAALQKDVRTVLTPDQQAVYDKNVAAVRERMQQMRAGGAPPQATPPQDPPPSN